VANTDIKKFGYKPMAMRLAESSEILDERIDEFMTIIQKHHNLDDSAFGNAAAQGTNEIVAVGRIASDTAEGKLNSASLVLETSRRMGAGIRVPLKINALTSSWQFFPGQIIALRGTNASGAYFTVSEVLQIPLLPVPVSSIQSIDTVNERLGISNESAGPPLNIMFASGPYTAEDNLDFEPLQALCSKAADEMADALVLTGPFLDIEHPLLASGDFDLPEGKGVDSDATLNTAFRLWISTPLQRLCSAVPSITIILVPSVRDAVSKHVSWPQDQLPKKELGLGLAKQVKMLPNPCTISLNETVIGISSQDILYELSREQVSGGGGGQDLMTRLPRFLIEQRHFYPLFPPVSRHQLPKGSGPKATGACLDLGYLKLGEWWNVRPDVLVVPSMLTPSVKVSLWQPSRFIVCWNFANHGSATGG
jgi:DNA polymerase alpha subunit B